MAERLRARSGDSQRRAGASTRADRMDVFRLLGWKLVDDTWVMRCNLWVSVKTRDDLTPMLSTV